MATAPGKNPVKQRAGLIGARTRWADNPAKQLRIGDLGERDRRLIAQIIAAVRAAANGHDGTLGEPRGD